MDTSFAPSLDEVISMLPKSYLPLVGSVEQSDALSINSNNFRIHTPRGVFVLKRWSNQTKSKETQKTLNIMRWLASQRLPVPVPVEICREGFILSSKSGNWSLFPFVDGSYFSGKGNELYAAAEITGQIMKALLDIPMFLMPSRGPEHMTNSDAEILCRVKESSKDWGDIFGLEHAELLLYWWPRIIDEWDRLCSSSLLGSRLQAAHFDLHPHNLLMMKGELAGVLDFESCKVMPVGTALGFAALKQCRQALAFGASRLHSEPRVVGTTYTTILVRNYPDASTFVAHLGDLAVAEVLRRICSILRLNLESGEKKWNKVLPIQLKHLGEARELFG